MSNVAGVVQKGQKAGLITFEDGSKPAWTPDFTLAKETLKIGAPIPSDWKLEQGEYGPKAMPPRKGGGAPTAWRNTKEGAEFENASRIRWQEYEQERMDRRTALMQAVAEGTGITTELAEKFYEWLRRTSRGSPTDNALRMGKARADSKDSPEAPMSPPQTPGRKAPERDGGTVGVGTSSPQEAAGDGGGLADSEPQPTSPTCDHDWQPAPKESMAAKGWKWCPKCLTTKEPA